MADKEIGRFKAFMIIMAAFMAFSLAAAAAVMSQLYKEKENNFEPAEAGIAIAENDSSPRQTAQNVMSLPEEGSRHIVEKKVQIKCTGDDQYVKAALVPQWYDSKGRVCGGLGDISDFGLAQPPDLATHTQKCVSAHNESFVILTYNLDPDWKTYWRYDETDGFYYYRQPLKAGEQTQPLIRSVEISPEAYSQSEGYELHIDVLAESIQTTTSVRNF